MQDQCIPDRVVSLHTSMQLWLVSGHFVKFERADLYSFAVSQNQINLTNRLKKHQFLMFPRNFEAIPTIFTRPQ